MPHDFWTNKGDSGHSEVLRKTLVVEWTQVDRSNFQTSADIKRIFFKIFLSALPTRLTNMPMITKSRDKYHGDM